MSRNPDEDNARGTLVTEMHVLEICEDIGTCWHDLGIALSIPAAVLSNIAVDYRFCHEKAREMLYEWMKRGGRYATVERLAKALERIKNRRIAQKLLDFQPHLCGGAQGNDAQETRSRTRQGNGSYDNVSEVHYGNMSFGQNNTVTYIGNQQGSTNIYVNTKNE